MPDLNPALHGRLLHLRLFGGLAARALSAIRGAQSRVIPVLAIGMAPLVLLVPQSGAAQVPLATATPSPSTEGWDTPEALSLAALGREARARQAGDGSLWSYTALTEGHIYFFVDSDEGDQALIRVDQVAVELFWEAPDLVRQRIVGERSETRLPVRDFRYYLDRLTLVQYGFGDEIEVGQGMDVAQVPHPLAPLSEPARSDAAGEGTVAMRSPYQFRLGGQVTLSLPGVETPIRVRELEVRPLDPTRPGVIGTLFLDEDDGQLVRMSIGFTPASYRDPRTDRITVSLDYGLWEGRYWLPNRQELEVRREIPEFDVGVGTVIRAVLRVGSYELNTPVSPALWQLPSITQAPAAERAAFPFREGLYDALVRDGLEGVRTRVDPAALRAEAQSRILATGGSGLSSVRLHAAGVSDVVRADRASGLTVGMGLSWRPAPRVRVRSMLGYAPSPRFPSGRLRVDLSGDDGGPRWAMEGFVREQRDLGVAPAIPGILGTASALLRGEDYLDPWLATGVRIRRVYATPERGPWGAMQISTTLSLETHRAQELRWSDPPFGTRALGAKAPGDPPRPVLSVHEGTWGRFELEGVQRLDPALLFSLPGSGRTVLRTRGEVLMGSGRVGTRVDGDLRHERQGVGGGWDAGVRLSAGHTLGDRLPQQTHLWGGRGTLPGFAFRSMAAPNWGLLSMEGSVAVPGMGPWLRIRGAIHGGVLGGALPEVWVERIESPSARPLGSLRGGVGIYYDILRVEGAYGLGAGSEWQLLVSIDPLWWPWL